jgi:hypothetical protein
MITALAVLALLPAVISVLERLGARRPSQLGLALFSGVVWFSGVAMLAFSVLVGVIAGAVAAVAVARASTVL